MSDNQQPTPARLPQRYSPSRQEFRSSSRAQKQIRAPPAAIQPPPPPKLKSIDGNGPIPILLRLYSKADEIGKRTILEEFTMISGVTFPNNSLPIAASFERILLASQTSHVALTVNAYARKIVRDYKNDIVTGLVYKGFDSVVGDKGLSNTPISEFDTSLEGFTKIINHLFSICPEIKQNEPKTIFDIMVIWREIPKLSIGNIVYATVIDLMMALSMYGDIPGSGVVTPESIRVFIE